MADSQEYFTCLICDISVPNNAADLHALDCNTGSFSHSFFRGNILHARLLAIDGDAFSQRDSSFRKNKKQSMSQTWLDFPEPEFILKFDIQFKERVIFLNRTDMDQCQLFSFSPVLVKAGNMNSCFVAAPCNSISLGSVAIYEKGLRQFLKITPETHFLEIHPLKVCMAKSITVDFEDNDLNICERIVQASVKLSLISNTDIENHVVLRLNHEIKIKVFDSVVTFKIVNFMPKVGDANSELQSCMTCNLPDDSILVKQNPSSSIEDSIGNISLKLSDLSVTSENMSYSNLRNIYRTSTPIKHASFPTTKKSIIQFKNTKKNKKMKNKRLEKDDCDGIYFTIDQYTTFNFISKESSKDFKSPKILKRPFYKHDSYKDFKKLLEWKLSSKEAAEFLSWQGILLSGLPGTGKTLMVHTVAEELDIPLIELSVLRLGESRLDEEEFLQSIFTKAKNCAPSILFLDQIDSLCPLLQNSREDGITRIILKNIIALKGVASRVLIIGATNRPETLSSKIRNCNILGKEIFLPLLQHDGRKDLLMELLSFQEHELSSSELDWLSQNAHGFSAADLRSLVDRASLIHVERIFPGELPTDKADFCLSFDDLKEGMQSVVPLPLKMTYTAVSKVSWDDIYGYNHLKVKLKALVKDNLNSNSLKGLLLYGPPGCSKTMFVKALVTESKFSFFPVKCSDLLSKYVGDTEKNLCTIFDQARLASPSLIFMDEVDSLCSERTGFGSSSTAVVSELLSLVQKTKKMEKIFIIAATNRPQCLDEGLFSAGCFDWVVHVDLPECESRCRIWEGILKRGPTEEKLHILDLCTATEGYSGAEIWAIYQESAISLLDSVDLDTISESSESIPIITRELILTTLSKFERRISISML